VGVTGYPVRTSGCSNQTIGGKYSSNAEGWGLAAPPFSFPPHQVLAGYFPFAFSGAMEFRPNVPLRACLMHRLAAGPSWAGILRA